MEQNYKRLTRTRADRKIAGVCGGLGKYFGIDPTLVRVILLVCLIFYGFGGLLYLILWAAVPEE